jgi:UDP-N-acetylmuramate dehydrogenase
VTVRGELAAELGKAVHGKVETDAPLGPLTTFRAGGPADVLVEAESDEDLIAVAELVGGRVPLVIVGRGSNMLVSDEGFRGVAVRLGRAFRDCEPTERGLRIGGAAHLPTAAKLTARLGLSGFEFAAEIPGSFGGAVRMNAGAHQRSMSDVLLWASAIDLSTGEIRTMTPDDLQFGYRHSSLNPSDIVTRGEVGLEPGDPAAIAARIADLIAWRRQHQPAGRSAGSMFKNPPGDSAGRLIDAAGGKGMRAGGAEVSSVHANFIVAGPGVRAGDIWTLMGRVRRLVEDRFGVGLEPEVRLVGEFPQVVTESEGGLEG